MFKYSTLSTMAQKQRLKNAKWRESDQQVKSIVDSILKNVSTAIDIRTTAGEVVLDIVEDAMSISDEANLQLKLQQSSRSKVTASLRRDWLIIDYRRTLSLPITNPINGHTYTISLQPSNMSQLKNVGYDATAISPGTSKHVYAALRSIIPDLRRSTSIRIWYTNDDGEYIIVPANEMPAVRLVGMKLFMTKLWCYSTPVVLEDEHASGID